jgi:hypothetical protein
MAWKDVQVAVFGFVGVIFGAYIAAGSSEKVAMAQIESQQKLARSEAAIKLIEYRSAPMADIYAANSKLQSAEIDAMDAAANQLAVAAAIAAARIDGETGKLCRELSEAASSFANVSAKIALDLKIKRRGEIGAKIVEVMNSYNAIQKPLIDQVLAIAPVPK